MYKFLIFALFFCFASLNSNIYAEENDKETTTKLEPTDGTTAEEDEKKKLLKLKMESESESESESEDDDDDVKL